MSKLNRLTKNLYLLFTLSAVGFVGLLLGIITNNKAWQIVALLILGVTIIVFIGVLIQNHRENRVIFRLQRAVKNLNLQTQAKPVLVRPDDEYKGLADEINELASAKDDEYQKSLAETTEIEKIINVLPVGVMVVDQAKDVIFANSQMEDILERQIKPEPHPYTLDIANYELLTMIDSVYSDHQSTRTEISEVSNDPKTIDVQVVYNRIKNSFHLVVIAYDISEVINIKQMQIDFLRNASHELKTPVTAISGFAKTLLDGAKDDPESLTEFLKIIDQQSDQLTSLINDVLTISHIQNHESNAAEPLLLRAFVDQEFKTQSNQIKAQNIQVENLIDEEFQVKIDSASLRRIVRNLISNAVKYNRPSGTISIDASRQGSFWYLNVKDTGIGISQKDLARIFERFYRSDESRNKQEVPGTGLGLSIVKELVDSLSGKITVRSQRGVGTTFTVRLPYID